MPRSLVPAPRFRPDDLAPACEPPINYRAPIRDWHEAERPREKALAKGLGTLSDAELLALIFGTGTVTKDGPISALGLGQAVMAVFKTMHGLAARDVRELLRVRGIGPAKAVQLAAAFEIGRRTEASRLEHERQRVKIGGPHDVAALLGARMRALEREVFVMVMLNTAGFVLGEVELTTGGLAGTVVEPRLVFRRAMLENAAAVIVAHNHPSGNPEPSPEDLRVTRQLVEAGKVVGIVVHDHVIVAGTGYTSLKDRGMM